MATPSSRNPIKADLNNSWSANVNGSPLRIFRIMLPSMLLAVTALDFIFIVATIKIMKITYDPAKRSKTLEDRGIDFGSAQEVFAGPKLDFQDTRKNYGETRMITFGFLDGRMVNVVWTQRGDARHIISMRKANEREIKQIQNRLD
jgi:uncharacterized protein